MAEALADLASLHTYGALLVFARVGAALMLLPGFGETYLPQRLKLAAALLVALAISGAVPGRPEAMPETVGIMAGQIGAEIMVGLLLGTSARLLLMALHVAGTVIAQQSGLGLLVAAAVEPEGTPAIAKALMFGGIGLIFALDLDRQLLLAVRDSYAVFPLGSLPDPGDMASHVTRIASETFAVGIRLSLPFLVIGFTVYVGLGVVNRAMPQMMVFFVAAPALTMIGLVLLAVVLPTVLLSWAWSFDTLMFGP